MSSESSTGDEATALFRPAISESLKPPEGFGSYSSLSTPRLGRTGAAPLPRTKLRRFCRSSYDLKFFSASNSARE